MRKCIIPACLVVLLLACSDKNNKAFKVPSDYRAWKKPVAKILDYPVPGHGPTFRVIYANRTAFSAKVTKDASGTDTVSMPDGSVLIKEIYKTRKDVNRKEPKLTIMVKDAKNKLALNGWLYYNKEAGKPIMLIEGRMCVGCHEAANEPHPYFDKNTRGIFRDYLFAQYAK
jgi:hypothetical protein